MDQGSTTFFADVIDELGQRAARSLVSKLSPISPPLRQHLHERLERLPGEAGSFLTDPVFEAGFGWELEGQSMASLSGDLLTGALVNAMDAPPPNLSEQRFAADWSPYTHQVTAWRRLRETPPRSIIVSSGTGSGKTECFLVPVLDDLVRQLVGGQPLVGVQALFLYPLNALINSQRDRLRAWTAAFNGKIRFALYNGDMPDEVPISSQKAHPEEILSRKTLRSSPPPILVTNATMLEYMLVRQQDHPIVASSQGMLRWIILDEAHTYIGSHAAEMSLLLRRVLHAFGAAASDVRFIATSATIGGADDQAGEKLKNYLADLAGIDPARVDVITGHRFVPELPGELTSQQKKLPPGDQLAGLDSAELFATLTSAPEARRLRTALQQGARTLTELTEVLTERGGVSAEDKRRTLELLDLCRIAEHDGEAFLPLRGHLFHRTQGGLWACCNASCPGKAGTSLDRAEWGFGKIFLGRRQVCDEPGCRSQVFEIVFCDACGADYLSAELQATEAGTLLRPRTLESDVDAVEEDTLIDAEPADEPRAEEDIEIEVGKFPRLVTVPSMVDVPAWVDPTTGEVDVSRDPQQRVGLLSPHGGLRCARCGQWEKREGELFRPARSSAAFHLLMSIPTLLEHTPPVDKGAADLPFEGRRLITFSDSRQGTARFSLQAQLDAERNYVRSWLYHQVSSSRHQTPPETLETLRRDIEQLEGVYPSRDLPMAIREYAALPEQHCFQIPEDAHWKATRTKVKNVGKAIQDALRAIETANPDTLYGVFGDAQWTNKDRLPDRMLRELIEHFSSQTLSLSNCPEDELGVGYEFLIKKFADDSGHTAAEFYTNRTVVHLMTEMLEPRPGESIYDPTCGSAGMLLSAVAHLKRQNKEWRNLRLFGQERNLLTSAIGRMNLFLHGIEDFRIVRGDTLSNPAFVEGDRLMQFDVVLANPPYSIKQWDRDAWSADPWGRNLYGTPPQGRADYAFWQHIIKSMKAKSGRCAILFPHGVLFRNEESAMREKLVAHDVVECVLGLGPNLFYNSPMEACVVICRMNKPKERRNKVLFINALNEVTRERAQSFLTDDHIQRIVASYQAFADEDGFARVVSNDEIREKASNLSIPLYVRAENGNGNGNGAAEAVSLKQAIANWQESSMALRESMGGLFEVLEDTRVMGGAE